MPFERRSIMWLREEICRLALQDGANRRQLAERFGVSPPTLYKWLSRFTSEGVAGLADRSRRPHASPGRTASNVEECVLMVRESHPCWGGRKIARRLMDLGDWQVPAPSVVTEILRRHDRLDPAESAKRGPWERFERARPNELWQMDFKGDFAIGSGRCHPLTMTDDHSRYNICLAACGDQRTATVKACLTEAFRRHGKPETILADNGSPWGNGPGHGLTPLTVWLMRHDIAVIHGRPYHPQTQGKEERFHRTLKSEALAGRSFCDLGHCQKHFDWWRTIYNTERPHQALDMATPISRYTSSPRTFTDAPPPIEYGGADIVRKVQDHGKISFKGRVWKLPKALKGYPVAFRTTTKDGVWEVFFTSHRVAQVDLRNPVALDHDV